MNFSSETYLCLVAWAITLIKLRAIHWKDVQKDGSVDLNIWLMMLFFSITLTFIGSFSDYFDAYTLNNLSRLISYPSILITAFLATRETLRSIEKPSHKRTIRWLSLSLVVTIIVLLVIYSLFLWKTPEFVYAPQGLPEAVFKFIALSFGGLLCFVVCREYMAYYPSEKSAVIRLRALMIILCAFSALAYSLAKIAQIGGYFWPWLASPTVNHLSLTFLVLTSLLYFVSFLNNKLYVRFMVISRNIQSWNSFQKLKYLIERILRLCPVVALTPNNPPFWSFMLNPEYYLYNAIVVILDGKSMLADLLSVKTEPGQPALWEDHLLQEAIQVNQALQAVNPSDDFWEIVGAYNRASQDLLQHQTKNFALETTHDIA
jgi:hypothetical protein